MLLAATVLFVLIEPSVRVGTAVSVSLIVLLTGIGPISQFVKSHQWAPPTFPVSETVFKHRSVPLEEAELGSKVGKSLLIPTLPSLSVTPTASGYPALNFQRIWLRVDMFRGTW